MPYIERNPDGSIKAIYGTQQYNRNPDGSKISLNLEFNENAVFPRDEAEWYDNYIDGIKIRKIEVEKLKKQKMIEGFEFNGDYFELSDRTMINAGLIYSRTEPNKDIITDETVSLPSINNTIYILNNQQANQYSKGMMDRWQNILQTATFHKRELEKLNNLEDLNNYDINQGW